MRRGDTGQGGKGAENLSFLQASDVNRDALDLFERRDAGESFLDSVEVHITKTVRDRNRLYARPGDPALDDIAHFFRHGHHFMNSNSAFVADSVT
jgi:hypothetical protein